MPEQGLERIRSLYKGVPGAQPLTKDDSDEEGVGIVQDFLREQSFDAVPSHKDEVGYGRFDRSTLRAVRNFFGIKADAAVVLGTKEIKKLLDEPPKSPRSRYSRVVLKLGFDSPKAILKVLSFVGLWEGGFHTLGRNKDGVGLSYGVIQWNQRDQRLAQIVGAFRAKKPELFKQSFGGAKAEDMFRHISGENGGVIRKPKPNAENGHTNRADLMLNLFKPNEGDLNWDQLFISAGHIRDFQKIEVEVAIKDFREIVTLVNSYASAKIKTQREMAYMIDLSNQHGRGGARSLFEAANKPELSGKALLEAIKEKSLKEFEPKFKQGVKDRRDFFINTKFLKDTPFNESEY